MKIDIQSINIDEFTVDRRDVNGEIAFLIKPRISNVKWTRQNKIFRSLLVDSEGYIISAGFPKFVDFGVNPETFPIPKDLNSSTIVNKEDGSLLVVSKYCGKWIFRTRGTVNARYLENGHEIDIIEKTILKKFIQNNFSNSDNSNVSFLFEWITPTNQIIIKTNEIKLVFIGCVSHHDYSLMTQKDLDYVADCFQLKRPLRYEFNNLNELLSNVKAWNDSEGVCLYTNNDQSIHRIKSEWYKNLTVLKNNLMSFDAILDVWLQYGKPNYTNFCEIITTTFDQNLVNYCRGYISNICDAYKEAKQIVDHMREFVSNLAEKSRKEQALAIMSAYGETERTGLVFNLLDNKPIEDKMWKKLIYQITKK